jgi:hypothetical protein
MDKPFAFPEEETESRMLPERRAEGGGANGG